MKSRALGSFLPFFTYWWGYRTAPIGKAVAACIAISAATASVSLEMPVYELLVALCTFALAVHVAAWLLQPKLDVQWRVPERAIAGRPFQIVGTLHQRGTRVARDIGATALQLPPSLQIVEAAKILDGIPSGESAEIAVELKALRRGSYACPPLHVFTLFPFGLFRTERRTTPTNGNAHARLVVYPHFHRLHAIDVPISARYQPGGIALSSSVGESTEYIGNREYRPGDSTRHLDHRSWARLATPAVREYQEEYYCRVALVLDTYVAEKTSPGPEGYPHLEAAISLAATVADALGRGEYIIDIFAAGPELYVFRAGRHTAHFENVLELLACVDACHTNPFRTITPALTDELANISSAICVFLDWDAERARLVQAAAEAGCSVKVVIVRDGNTTLPYTAASYAGPIAQYAPETVKRGGIDVL